MDLDVAPDPGEEVREALAAALEERHVRDAEGAGSSAWWRAGVAESARADFERDEFPLGGGAPA